MKPLLTICGFLAIGLGTAGLFIPVWPSTVFFIVALGCFAKSNPEAERRLLEHPKFGAALRDWREQRAISRKSKVTACIAIVLSIGISVYFTHSLWLRILLALTAVALVIYLGTRPEPKAYREDQSRRIS
ncbi:MAG: YbaN family protein [Armatimonadota bacterium]|nr:YbaN family protein [Armatimonadota bacterium]